MEDERKNFLAFTARRPPRTFEIPTRDVQLEIYFLASFLRSNFVSNDDRTKKRNDRHLSRVQFGSECVERSGNVREQGLPFRRLNERCWSEARDEEKARERERNDEADWKAKIKGYEAAARLKSRSRKRFSAASSTKRRGERERENEREKKERGAHRAHGKIK